MSPILKLAAVAAAALMLIAVRVSAVHCADGPSGESARAEAVAEADDIRDIKGPVELPVSRTAVLAASIAACIAALAISLVLWKSRHRTRPVRLPRQKLPHEIAYEEMRALLAEGLLDERRREQFYVCISGTVRRYLESRFGLRAPEMTTEEFLGRTSSSSELAVEHRLLLAQFLLECDLVKFARHGPSAGEMEKMYASAMRFINETVPGEEITATRVSR